LNYANKNNRHNGENNTFCQKTSERNEERLKHTVHPGTTRLLTASARVTIRMEEYDSRWAATIRIIVMMNFIFTYQKLTFCKRVE
jgi:hypothetical protein